MAIAKDFLPSRDALLLAWSANFNSVAGGSPTSVGLTAGQMTSYGTAHSAFAAAYAVVTDPSTKTVTSVAAKDASIKSLKLLARQYAKIVNAYPPTTNIQRLALGLTPRAATVSPIHAPTEAPVMEVVATMGRSLKLKLHGTGTALRGKPAGCAGAAIYSFMGLTPPANLADWKSEGSATRTIFTIVFPPTAPAGSQVWLSAAWFNPRNQTGPACTPVEAWIAGGVSAAA